MREQQLRAEEVELRKKIQEKSKDGSLKSSNGDAQPKKRGRWDQTVEEQFLPAKKTLASEAATPTWGDMDVRKTTLITKISKIILYMYFFL